jgi:hypothetical protein
MKPFLDCAMWSVHRHYAYPDFYFVEEVYYYNSNNTEYNTYKEVGSIEVPEFEIKNMGLLDGLNFSLINENKIPIVSSNNGWEINLKYYEQFLHSNL